MECDTTNSTRLFRSLFLFPPISCRDAVVGGGYTTAQRTRERVVDTMESTLPSSTSLWYSRHTFLKIPPVTRAEVSISCSHPISGRSQYQNTGTGVMFFRARSAPSIVFTGFPLFLSPPPPSAAAPHTPALRLQLSFSLVNHPDVPLPTRAAAVQTISRVFL